MDRDRQLYLEVAQAMGRHLRSPASEGGGGMGGDAALANADHYWFARWGVFMVTGFGWNVTGAPVALLSPALGEVTGLVGRGAGWVFGAAAFEVMTLGWDLWKRAAFALDAPELIPGDSAGDATPSRPSGEQIRWANEGIADSALFDYEYASDWRPGLALNSLPDGSLIVPDPP